MILQFIHNLLEWPSNMQRTKEICERFVKEVLAIRFVVLGGHQRSCNLLGERCECFSLYSSKVLIKFLSFSREHIYDLFDRWNHVKLCVGFLYFRISSSFFFLLVAHRSCVAPLHRPSGWLWEQFVSQQLVSEQRQREDVCNQVRYAEVSW